MKYQIVEKDGVTIFSFVGDLSIFDFNSIHIDFLAKNKIIIDFSKTTFINSDVVTWLINLHKIFEQNNKETPIITGCNELVSEILVLLGADRLFEIVGINQRV